ncbi:PRC-barrel domain-containing protein [Burkholderia sp. L27(2015)]|uniref:PRC-barrel domain-containing protein n=1 Tax=Burkholderia sp. L27(2015) TaxID=1641858 RepID=UPI00131D2EB8|nr:PRC-barrel domain-containing protein [Burkholderia sp. L27(2015)]
MGGCVVFASDGESVGVVTEVIVDVAGRVGQIAYVLVAPKHPAVGQSELRALPWSALLFDPARHCFTLEVNSAVVRNAPETISKGWPVMPDEQWKMDVHRYYHPTETYMPSAPSLGADGHAIGPMESPVRGLAQAPERAPVQTPVQAPVAAPIEPRLDSDPDPDPDPDPKAVEHDFLPELGLKSPFRRREPGSK